MLEQRMKRHVVHLLVGLLAVSLTASAWALPPLPKYVSEYYAARPEYAKFSEAWTALTLKCNACHKPGADKKAKGHGLNDFGEAMHKHLKHKEFLAADKAKLDDAKMAELAKRLVAEALAAAEAAKKDNGKTYGELMKAGTLPGTN
jgi:hypothetical protein